jgi:hypothetical protein
MGGQRFIPRETAEEKEARRMKREAEAERRANYLWSNYQREHLNGGNSNARVIDWSKA